MLLRTVYWSIPAVVCFDGEGEGEGDPGDGNPDQKTPPQGDGETITLTQAKLNEMMANHKRSLKAELDQTKTSLQETESQLQQLLESKELNGAQTEQLQTTLENVRKQLRTKEQQSEIDKQKLQREWEDKYKDAEERATSATKALENHLMERSWIDSVGGDAYDLQQFLDLTMSKTKMVEDEEGNKKVVVDLPDFDAEGNPTVSQFTPTEAVARMKELPQKYGNLFKSNVSAGLGGSNATGGVNSGNAKLDITKVDYKTFERAAKANPSAFGLADYLG